MACFSLFVWLLVAQRCEKAGNGFWISAVPCFLFFHIPRVRGKSENEGVRWELGAGWL
jgi:hypothetical protein